MYSHIHTYSFRKYGSQLRSFVQYFKSKCYIQSKLPSNTAVVSSQLQSELLTEDISTHTEDDIEDRYPVENAMRKRSVHRAPSESEMEEIPSRPVSEDTFDRDIDLFDFSVD